MVVVMIVVTVMLMVVVIIFVIIILLAIIVIAVVVLHWARCCQSCLCLLCSSHRSHLFIDATIRIRDHCSDCTIRLDSGHSSFHLVVTFCRCCSLLLVIVVLLTSFGFYLVV